MRFLLSENALYCANGGYPFTPEGLEAVCRLSHSPKEGRQQSIGEKGLGFKAVLSLSREPEIHSANLHCRFRREDGHRFLGTSRFLKQKYPGLNPSNVPLLRLPFDATAQFESDPLLLQLCIAYASVIKLPLSPGQFREAREWLTQIDPAILLFLNGLEQIEIQDAGAAPRMFRIEREHVLPEDHCRQQFCLLSDGSASARWQVFSAAVEVPASTRNELHSQGQASSRCAIAFAVPLAAGDGAPALPNNRIRVYFPTDETFPLPFLMHGDFFTDSARKQIHIEHPYNRFVLQSAVDFFLKMVLPRLARAGRSDPAAHLEYLLPSTADPHSPGGYFATLLWRQLPDAPIFPAATGRLRKAAALAGLPFPAENWAHWYKLLGKSACRDLNLVHPSASRPHRRTLLTQLDVKKLPFATVLEMLQTHPRSEPAWFAELYRLTAAYLESLDEMDRKAARRACREFGLALDGRGEIVSARDHPVFVHRENEAAPEVPEALDLHFLHPALSRELGSNPEMVYRTYLQHFGIARFDIPEIIRQFLAPKLETYRDIPDHSPPGSALLRFAYDLLQPQLSDDFTRSDDPELAEILARLPLPAADPQGRISEAPAGQIYFGSSWMGNDRLEKLYDFDPDSRFLPPRAHFRQQGFPEKRLAQFFYYIGVANAPRLLELHPHSEIQHGRWYRKYLAANEVRPEVAGSYRAVNYDCTLDRLEEIFRSPLHAGRLLLYLAAFPRRWQDTRSAEFIYQRFRTKSYKRLETNYLKWLLQHYPWLYDERESPFAPEQIFLPGKSLQRLFGDYIPYVNYPAGEEDAARGNITRFLQGIGVQSHVEDLSAPQWYAILSDLPDYFPKGVVTADAAKIVRGIYQTFLQAELDIAGAAPQREQFLRQGRLLASRDRQMQFYPVSQVYYADRLDILHFFQDKVNCLPVETGREALVMERFGVPALSRAQQVETAIGTPAPALDAALNRFFSEARPYLVARFSRRDDSGENLERWKHLQLRTAEGLSFAGTVSREDIAATIEIPSREVPSLLIRRPEHPEGWNIYINIRQIPATAKTMEAIRHHQLLHREIALRLCDLFETDLSEAFQMILGEDREGREQILRDNHIDPQVVEDYAGQFLESTD